MTGVVFTPTSDEVIPWILYDPASETLVVEYAGETQCFGAVPRAEYEWLMAPGRLRAELVDKMNVWQREDDRIFNAWYAMLFAGMVAGCDTLWLSPRSKDSSDIMSLTKLTEMERNQRLDRDSDCNGTITEHVLVLLPPLDPDAEVLEQRCYRLYHISTAAGTMVPPRPALLGRIHPA